MRTFIAIPLPRECRLMLEQLQEKLRSFKAEVRWVGIPSIHLTLKFLGEVDPGIIPKLSKMIEDAVQNERSFELRLHGLGCFPNLRNPRVIWCGLTGEADNLLRLQRCVEDACAELGFACEERPFHPHLTLGRVNGKRNLQPLLDYIKIGSDLECSFNADQINIYRSILRPQGAEYSILKSIVLNE
ncbi:MAG: RNA 2',3'-cyclic phosphodiesterase [Acidobacteria bacterium]|nr:RNA 2',3'-cyclic phosphodiesterase [Acidobacteriota bacterium]